MSGGPRALVLLIATTTLVALGGCALNGLPRIDPSGDRIFLFPDSPAATPGQAPAPTFSPAPQVGGTLPAPPVYSDAGTGLCDLVFGGGGVPPAVPVGAQAAAEPPGERLTLTPSKVLAPVGTEVVLRAGVCGEDNYLLTNRRIEWMLGAEGAGQFVTVGERGERDFGRFPWSTPEKIDNHYAVGYTAPFYTCLRRGTEDPSDDLQVQRGDAWISVTSASEGTSYVTAFAPGVDSWPTRRARTLIYWVDAQWQFPPSATVAAGQPHTLVTTVTRKTDGAPIAGWIVRYESADAGARLGYAAGQVAEATTDNRGRASIEVTPVNPGGGASNIAITIVRPEQAGVAASPRIDVATGAATVNWVGGGPITPSPGLPPATPPTQPFPPTPTPPSGTEPRPSLPSDYTPPTPREPPIATPRETGRPNLEVTVKQDPPGQLRPGDKFDLAITVQNRGDGPARRIVVRDRFDAGLKSPVDSLGSRELTYNQMPDLKPGESESIRLPFEVVTEGRLRTEVTVTAEGAEEAFGLLFIDVVQQRPELRIETVGSAQREVGQEFEFDSVVENVGTVVAKNVVVELRYDPALEPTMVQQGESRSRLADGGFRWILPRLEPGAKQKFAMLAGCVRPNPQAQVVLTVRADGVEPRSMPWVVEIVPARVTPPGGAAGAPATASPITVELDATANRTRVGERSILMVYITNTGRSPVQGVDLRVEIPPQVRPQIDSIKGPTATAAPPYIQFQTIAQMQPGERRDITIPIEAISSGQAAVRAQFKTQTLQQAITVEGTTIEVLPR